MPLYIVRRTFKVERDFAVEAPTADDALEATDRWEEIEEVTQDVLDTEVFLANEEEA